MRLCFTFSEKFGERGKKDIIWKCVGEGERFSSGSCGQARLGRCWEGLEFLVRRWCGDGVEKVLGGGGVSRPAFVG